MTKAERMQITKNMRNSSTWRRPPTRLSPHAKPFVPANFQEPEPESEEEEEEEDEKPEPEPVQVEYGICQMMSFACMFILLWMFMSVFLMNQQQFEVMIDYWNTAYPQMLNLLTAVVALSREAINWSIAFYWNTAYPQMLHLLAYFKETVYPQLLEHANHVAWFVSKTVCG